MKKLFFFSVIFTFAIANAGEEKSTASAIKLKNFREGSYHRSAGKEMECADGEFSINTSDQVVLLGPVHAFLLKPETGELKGDAPGDEKCSYRYSYSGDSTPSADHLSFKETRHCGKELKHTLVKTVSIQSHMIILEAEQKGSPDFKYSCVWERETGLADAGQ